MTIYILALIMTIGLGYILWCLKGITRIAAKLDATQANLDAFIDRRDGRGL